MATLRLKILQAHKSQLDAAWNCKLDNSPFAKIYYVESGAGFLRHHDQEFKLMPGRICLIPPLSGLSYGCDNKVEIWWAHFSAEVLSALNLFEYLNFSFQIAPKNTEHMRIIISNLITIFNEDSPDAQLLSNGLLLQMLAPFIKKSGSKVNAEKQAQILRFQPALKHIERHLGEKISVSALAKKVSLERAYFSTLFAKVFGISPALYINRKRIENAQAILRGTETKLEAIASELGFTDGFHLSKTFKKITGISPSEFKKRNRRLTP